MFVIGKENSMMPHSKIKQLIEKINSAETDVIFTELYGSEAVALQKKRYTSLSEDFDRSGYNTDGDIMVFSVPGRSELSGNHTDHNHGKVIASSIDLDIIAVAAANGTSVIRVKSEGFDEISVDFSKYISPMAEKFTTSDALIAGMCRGFRDRGFAVGGFDVCITSNVFKGSGLSSSAAFEVMIGNILNHMFNNDNISNTEIAKIAQFSENAFFGKPCGLMDQMACAVGGIISIDFADPADPIITKLDFDFSAAGYNLCIVNTGGNHADLGEDYASIPSEMRSVAAYFGKEYLREIDAKTVTENIPALREALGDRAILRALHFFGENIRVDAQKEALLGGDINRYFENVLESGRSSFCYLQNVYTTKNPHEQGLSLALCLAESALSGQSAAWRVHGGGFAGTIQAYVPMQSVESFSMIMDSAFGNGACVALRIRQKGAIRII